MVAPDDKDDADMDAERATDPGGTVYTGGGVDAETDRAALVIDIDVGVVVVLVVVVVAGGGDGGGSGTVLADRGCKKSISKRRNSRGSSPAGASRRTAATSYRRRDEIWSSRTPASSSKALDAAMAPTHSAKGTRRS